MERRYGKITRPRSSHSTRRHILNHDHDLGCVSFSNLFSCTLPLKPTSLSSKGFFCFALLQILKGEIALLTALVFCCVAPASCCNVMYDVSFI